MTIRTVATLIRHAEAACNAAAIVGGEKGCTGLTSLGHRQANAVAGRISAEHHIEPYDMLVCSPRLRVRQTTEPISTATGLPYTVINDLRGPDHGDADAQPWAQIKETFGGSMQHQPDKPIAPGGDSWNSYLDRATAALDRILTEHEGNRILIIGHSETIEAAHNLLLGLPRGSSTRVWIHSNHTAIARWRLQVNRRGRATWLLDTHNDTQHLAELP
ncbi:histidine phosphatase family protein [Micromonospora polyrhachis]|uniref:Putative phosphoglycerate mutase n=1 Tax=Micromonospora polyrhachis TaxID=1282883 RepID=A0A7W7SNL9_9ACTN|nr:histidine phosphatase family protein [Micromonospora polyrhachis]MBB4957746.1 putative phosphoglycerate mutase [Micromonospora polyrhachis]